MRTVFFGTPEIAVPALAALAESTNLVTVYCQPDRPAGRGMRLIEPPIKKKALELGLRVQQPVKVRDGRLATELRELQVDYALVLAYGRILPQDVLDAPRLGCLNLHASLLPAYRGAAPINWAIINGERETGISLMQMDEGMDTGPVFLKRRLSIREDQNAGELAAELSELAASMVREDLPKVPAGEATCTPQNAALATLAPPIRAEHTGIDFSKPVRQIINQVRGLFPKPAATTQAGKKRLKLVRVSAGPADLGAGHAPGTIVRADKGGLFVRCGEGCLKIDIAQLEGKKALPARDLVNGRALVEGMVLGS
ncbi:MAG: methionyl-tRNA formyltransferase [Polyangiaceae bacterium]|nr:methionyl-tRNA formyltransferase [Polyangiaceae bacterium]